MEMVLRAEISFEPLPDDECFEAMMVNQLTWKRKLLLLMRYPKRWMIGRPGLDPLALGSMSMLDGHV